MNPLYPKRVDCLKCPQYSIQAGHGERLLRLTACLGSEELYSRAVGVLRVHEADETGKCRLVLGRGVLSDNRGEAGVNDFVLSFFALYAAAAGRYVHGDVVLGHLGAVPVGRAKLNGCVPRAGYELTNRPHGADGVEIDIEVREDFHFSPPLPVRFLRVGVNYRNTAASRHSL